MEDKDKLILAFYVNVSGMDGKDIGKYLAEVSENTKFDDSVRTFFIPTLGETRIESLNPKYVTKKEYEKVVTHFNEMVDKAVAFFEQKNIEEEKVEE